MLFQKEFITDPISKKHKINRGELLKYLIEETHTAIVSMEEFQIVQNMIAKKLYTCCFIGKIKCPYHNHKYVHVRKPKFQEDNWRCSAKKCEDCILTRGIDHQKLVEATEKILGVIDEDIVLDKIDCIFVSKDDIIEFHLKDGTVAIETYIKERRRCLK